MTYLYDKCKGQDSSLISPQEIINYLMPKFEINANELEQIMNGLVLDNYVEVVHSDSKGKLIYCVSLKQKGASFEREKLHYKKTTYLIVVRTVLLAILSTLIGILIRSFFS